MFITINKKTENSNVVGVEDSESLNHLEHNDTERPQSENSIHVHPFYFAVVTTRSLVTERGRIVHLWLSSIEVVVAVVGSCE